MNVHAVRVQRHRLVAGLHELVIDRDEHEIDVRLRPDLVVRETPAENRRQDRLVVLHARDQSVERGCELLMLAYPGEGHGLRGIANRKDLTIRYFQFFNHYLKGEPAPKWMSEGVPYLEKK